MYKIGEVGSGVDYMYLDSSGGSWQMSKYLVNISQGALGQTLIQLYMRKAYQVRLAPCIYSCGYHNLPKHSFSLLGRHSGSCGEPNPRSGSWPSSKYFSHFFYVIANSIFNANSGLAVDAAVPEEYRHIDRQVGGWHYNTNKTFPSVQQFGLSLLQ